MQAMDDKLSNKGVVFKVKQSCTEAQGSWLRKKRSYWFRGDIANHEEIRLFCWWCRWLCSFLKHGIRFGYRFVERLFFWSLVGHQARTKSIKISWIHEEWILMLRSQRSKRHDNMSTTGQLDVKLDRIKIGWKELRQTLDEVRELHRWLLQLSGNEYVFWWSVPQQDVLLNEGTIYPSVDLRWCGLYDCRSSPGTVRTKWKLH